MLCSFLILDLCCPSVIRNYAYIHWERQELLHSHTCPDCMELKIGPEVSPTPYSIESWIHLWLADFLTQLNTREGVLSLFLGNNLYSLTSFHNPSGCQLQAFYYLFQILLLLYCSEPGGLICTCRKNVSSIHLWRKFYSDRLHRSKELRKFIFLFDKAWLSRLSSQFNSKAHLVSQTAELFPSLCIATLTIFVPVPLRLWVCDLG